MLMDDTDYIEDNIPITMTDGRLYKTNIPSLMYWDDSESEYLMFKDPMNPDLIGICGTIDELIDYFTDKKGMFNYRLFKLATPADGPLN